MFRHLLLPCLALTLLTAAHAQPAESVHQGTVVSTGANKITIVDMDGENETFALAKDAQIKLNGKPAGLGDIDKGDMARITTKKVDGEEVAVKIEARTKR